MFDFSASHRQSLFFEIRGPELIFSVTNKSVRSKKLRIRNYFIPYYLLRTTSLRLMGFGKTLEAEWQTPSVAGTA